MSSADPSESFVCKATGATRARRADHIQSLWSGYGELFRMTLDGASVESCVVKRVEPPKLRARGRDGAPDLSHQRKLRSYAIEANWYQHWAARCDDSCRVPHCYAVQAEPERWLFVLEDLDASGYAARASRPNPSQIQAVVRWLAAFHAKFLGEEPAKLWAAGTYWHLATRPDELAQMRDPVLRAAAPKLDARLNQGRYRTLVHGDAKSDNFCFPSANGASAGVPAVDFQYVGGGCGMKDVAYFFSSVWSASECRAYAADALSEYFVALRSALREREIQVELDALEAEWRSLYPVAWADFQRFLLGWAPGHFDRDTYASQMVQEALRTC